jgi:hypothetical protein
VYLVHSEPGPCRAAWHHTMQILQGHYPALSRALVVMGFPSSDEPAADPISAHDRTLCMSPGALEELSRSVDAAPVSGIRELERLLKKEGSGSRRLSISAASIASEAIESAEEFARGLHGTFLPCNKPFARTCLVTSLYDEQNLIRLNEYLSCLVLNLQVFERIVIFYESTSGLLGSVVHQLSAKLSLAPGRLLLVPCSQRPTFEALFSAQALSAEGGILAVANADVLFDASWARLHELDFSRKVAVLSRREPRFDSGLSQLLHLRTTGAPNIFSADAWIVSTPFAPDFVLDYEIGTMYCDSFINHQISISQRYDAVNPCFDVQLFHMHDERFNSTFAKRTANAESIQASYEKERNRCAGANPIRGIAWSTVANGQIPGRFKFQTLKVKALLFEFGDSASEGLGAFLVLHHIYLRVPEVLEHAVTVARLRRADLEGRLGILLGRYQVHHGRDDFQLDLDDGDFAFGQPSLNASELGRVSLQALANLALQDAPAAQWNALLWPRNADGPLHSGLRIVGPMSEESLALLRRKLQMRLMLDDFFSGELMAL